MKGSIAVFGLAVMATVTAAQDKVPVVPDKNRADIRDIQLRMVQAQNEYNQINNRMAQLQDVFRKDGAALQAATADACKAAAADCDKDWTLDLTALKFVKKEPAKETPATPPAAQPPTAKDAPKPKP